MTLSQKKGGFLADMSGVCEIDADASSSAVILPSQHDDVVIIEETDPGFDNIDSMDLLNEMRKGNSEPEAVRARDIPSPLGDGTQAVFTTELMPTEFA